MVEKHEGRIDLLMIDMLMPPVTGQELAARLKEQRFGYGEGPLRIPYEPIPRCACRGKPFTRTAMLLAVHELLSKN